MIIPMVNFYAEIPRPNAIQVSQLRKWFWQCALSLRYKAGTNRLVLEDLGKMTQVANGGVPFDGKIAKMPDDLFKRTWRINSTAAKASLCLMAQLRPKSFLTGSEVDLGTVLSAYNARQFHHIYPKAFLKAQGITFHTANVIANICFLSASENNHISDKNPKEYFQKIPKDQKDDIFEASVIPKQARDGRLPFDEFMKIRSAKLKEIGQKLIAKGMI